MSGALPAGSSEGLNSAHGGEYQNATMHCEATRLMTAAKHGDREAFDLLVASVRGRAFHLAQGLVGSREDALELAQEAFLKTYRARATYRDGEPFLPWFQRILRNTCFSHLKRKGRVATTSLSAPSGREEDGGEGDWELVSREPDPTLSLEGGERARIFWGAYQGLGANQREILALRHFRELSYQEIADHLGIPVGTVMSRLFHARRQLRSRLGGLLEDEDGPAGRREPARGKKEIGA